jgi:hypothetical protein
MRDCRTFVTLLVLFGAAPWCAQGATAAHHAAARGHHPVRPAHKPRPVPARPDLTFSQNQPAPRPGYADRMAADPNAPTRLSVEQPLGFNGLMGSIGYQRDRAGAIDPHEVNSAAAVQLDRSYGLVGGRVSYVFK